MTILLLLSLLLKHCVASAVVSSTVIEKVVNNEMLGDWVTYTAKWVIKRCKYAFLFLSFDANPFICL